MSKFRLSRRAFGAGLIYTATLATAFLAAGMSPAVHAADAPQAVTAPRR